MSEKVLFSIIFKVSTQPDEQTQYVYSLASKFEGIIRLPDFKNPLLFKMEFDRFPTKKVTQEQIDDHMKPILEELHAQLKIDRTEKVPVVTINSFEEKALEYHILSKLKENKFLFLTELRNLMANYGFKKVSIDRSIESLISQNIITRLKARGPTKDREYFPLTEKGRDILQLPENERISISHYKHTLYCNIVENRKRLEGFETFLEYSDTEGNPQVTIETESGRLVNIPKRIDVMAIKNGERHSFEITLSFSNLLQNVYKNFEIFKNIHTLHIVCESKDPSLDRAIEIVSKNVAPHLYEKITFHTMSDFF